MKYESNLSNVMQYFLCDPDDVDHVFCVARAHQHRMFTPPAFRGYNNSFSCAASTFSVLIPLFNQLLINIVNFFSLLHFFDFFPDRC